MKTILLFALLMVLFSACTSTPASITTTATTTCPDMPDLTKRVHLSMLETGGQAPQYWVTFYKNDKFGDGFEYVSSNTHPNVTNVECRKGDREGENVNYLYCKVHEYHAVELVKQEIDNQGNIGKTIFLYSDPIFDIKNASKELSLKIPAGMENHVMWVDGKAKPPIWYELKNVKLVSNNCKASISQ